MAELEIRPAREEDAGALAVREGGVVGTAGLMRGIAHNRDGFYVRLLTLVALAAEASASGWWGLRRRGRAPRAPRRCT